MAVLKKPTDPTPKIIKAIAKWRALFIPFKKSEKTTNKLADKVDKQKAVVIGELKGAGLETFESPYGVVSLQSKTSIDWATVLGEVINELGLKGINVRSLVDIGEIEKRHTKTGEVFVRAPQAWSGKAS